MQTCEEIYAKNDGLSGYRTVRIKVEQMLKKLDSNELDMEVELNDIVDFLNQEIEQDEL